ncbi:50S ribosomal protein L21 [Chitinivibrio alkaliphilus]|uniref:Large ribosomal subunit protein bL21 n=1 Tax=Chitinivibrio alkaliphilus ACht1 TaxID=1313304 RepID=U7D6X1_9BACT|nr:50S ribosomal protein L21 [Chitinivibrio alkaliphilus]ERP38715.1 ribosomal protein L21 [Chitinivibrio alkaliphilus ACht1]
MFSIVEQAGFQYKVTEGDVLEVPLIDAKEGDEIVLDRVLLLSDGADTKVGSPTVDGAEVKAEVVEHGKGAKVLVIKRKRRKDYKRKNGHRQAYTKIKITSINS